MLVTGASRGIGRAVARAFAERGDRVAVHFASYANWQQVWRRMIDVDLLGAANVTFGVATHLIERDAPGSNVGSRGPFRDVLPSISRPNWPFA